MTKINIAWKVFYSHTHREREKERVVWKHNCCRVAYANTIMRCIDLLTQISESLCMWNLDDGSMITMRWLEALANQRRQELDVCKAGMGGALVAN